MSLTALAVVMLFAFFMIERSIKNRFIDFNLFSNKTYTGATISNFLLNGTAFGVAISAAIFTGLSKGARWCRYK